MEVFIQRFSEFCLKVAIAEVPFRVNVALHVTQSSSVRCERVATETVQKGGERHRFSEQAASRRLIG
jgi:hypothetical protein